MSFDRRSRASMIEATIERNSTIKWITCELGKTCGNWQQHRGMLLNSAKNTESLAKPCKTMQLSNKTVVVVFQFAILCQPVTRAKRMIRARRSIRKHIPWDI